MTGSPIFVSEKENGLWKYGEDNRELPAENVSEGLGYVFEQLCNA